MIENRLQEVINEVNKVIEKVKENSFITINEIKVIPNKIGVYIIRNNQEGIFYVGSANKQTLFQRLGKNHIKGQGQSVLRKKLAQIDNKLTN